MGQKTLDERGCIRDACNLYFITDNDLAKSPLVLSLKFARLAVMMREMPEVTAKQFCQRRIPPPTAGASIGVDQNKG